MVGTWIAARAEAPEITERDVREALERLEPVWGELFPVEQARVVRALVDRVVVARVQMNAGSANFRTILTAASRRP